MRSGFGHSIALALLTMACCVCGCQPPIFMPPKAPQFRLDRPGPPPTDPQPPHDGEIDIRKLIRLEEAIPDVPDVRNTLELERVDRNEYLGRQSGLVDVRWLGTEEPLIRRAPAGGEGYEADGAKNRLVVLVEEREVRKYLADAMMRELQKQPLVELVERQYEQRITDQKDGIDKGKVFISDPVDQVVKGKGILAADYVVFLHVGVDNSASPRIVDEPLPLEVPPDIWLDYEQRKAEYLDEVHDYRQAIEAYNREVRKMEAWLRKDYEENFLPRREEYQGKYAEYLRKLSKYREDVRKYNNAVRRYAEEYEAYLQRFDEEARAFAEKQKREVTARPEPRLPLEEVADPPQQDRVSLGYRYKCPEEKMGPPSDLFTSEGRFRWPANQDCPEEEESWDEVDMKNVHEELKKNDDKLHESPWELLEDEKATVRYTVFRFGLSVRVVDYSTGANVWFGFTEAQHLDFRGAVKAACEEIATHLVEQPGRVLLDFGQAEDLTFTGPDRSDPGPNVATAKATVEDGVLVLNGRITSAFGGRRKAYGYTRSEVDATSFSAESALAIRIRGDGRTYNVFLNTDERNTPAPDRPLVDFGHGFVAEPGPWQVHVIPVSRLTPSVAGSSIEQDRDQFNAARIQSLGFSCTETRPGPYQLQVDWVRLLPSTEDLPTDWRVVGR